MDTKRPCTDAELVALGGVLHLQAVAAQASLASLGHTQVDPLASVAYARVVQELVDRGILPTDDVFAPRSKAEDELGPSGG